MSQKDSKLDLSLLLEQIRINLNQNGECIIQKIGNLEHSSLFLKLIKKHVDPQYVQSFDVPVFVTNLRSFYVDDWDLTTNRVKTNKNLRSSSLNKNYFFRLLVRLMASKQSLKFLTIQISS